MGVPRTLETLVHVTPLIVRCIDTATGQQVADGLRLTAVPAQGRRATTAAFVTGSGLYGFEGLSGLRNHEYFTEAILPPSVNVANSPILSPALDSPHSGKPFIILVEDPANRFMARATLLTLPHRDLFSAWLFSAPARTPLPGLAVLRGTVKDSTRHAPDGTLLPAAYAYIQARYDPMAITPDGIGLSDERGEFAVFLPHPNPLSPPSGVPITSPNTVGRTTIAQQTWPLTLTFRYAPAQQQLFCVGYDNAVETASGLDLTLVGQRVAAGWRCAPEIQSLLTQPQVNVFGAAGGLPAATLQARVAFGQENIARTANGDGGIWLAP